MDFCRNPSGCGIGNDCSECYQDEIKHLRSEVEALRADKARLDWLEKMKGSRDLCIEAAERKCGLLLKNFDGVIISQYERNTLRQAIDAARED